LTLDAGENRPSVEERESVIEGAWKSAADIAEGREAGIAAEQRLGIENAEHDRRRSAVTSSVGDGEIRRGCRAVESNARHACWERAGYGVEEEVSVRPGINEALRIGDAIVGGGEEAERVGGIDLGGSKPVVRLCPDAENQRTSDGGDPAGSDRG